MIQTSFDRIYRETLSGEPTTTSAKAAKSQITDANEDVDSHQSEETAAHFDAENFDGAQSRLNALYDRIKSFIVANLYSEARTSTGQYLHTMQDFYSHSTWIEMGNTSPNGNLGNGLGLTPPAESTRTCVRDDKGESIVPNLLFTGYYGGQDKKMPSSRKCIHGGFFDSYTNCGGASDSDDIWCHYTSDDGEMYINSRTNEIQDFAPPGFSPFVGINKDGVLETFSPHADKHDIAAAVATEATYNLFKRIKADVPLDKFVNFIGGTKSLAFAIDTTSSMSDEIETVKDFITRTISSNRGEGFVYVISVFNDPSVGPVNVYTNATAALAFVASLYAYGGGVDCPELSAAGLLNAIDKSPEGTNLYFFTDANAKDSDLLSEVAIRSAAKNIKIFPYISGSCYRKRGQNDVDTETDHRPSIERHKRQDSPTAIEYSSLATLTGGILLQVTKSSSDLSLLLPITTILSYPDLQTIAFTPKPPSPNSSTKNYTATIDSTASSVIIVCSGCYVLKVFNNGIQLTPNNTYMPGSNLIHLYSNFTTGLWVIQASFFPQYFALQVMERSRVGVSSSFRYYPVNSLHPAYTKYSGIPPGGMEISVFVELDINATSVKLDILNVTGDISQTKQMERFGGAGIWMANVTLPTSYILRYTFTDVVGETYVRSTPTIGSSTSISVTSSNTSITMRPGDNVTVSVNITNNNPNVGGFLRADVTFNAPLVSLSLNKTNITVAPNGFLVLSTVVSAPSSINSTSVISLSVIVTDRELSTNSNYLLSSISIIADDYEAPFCFPRDDCVCYPDTISCSIPISLRDDSGISYYVSSGAGVAIYNTTSLSNRDILLYSTIPCNSSSTVQQTIIVYDTFNKSGSCNISLIRVSPTTQPSTPSATTPPPATTSATPTTSQSSSTSSPSTVSPSTSLPSTSLPSTSSPSTSSPSTTSPSTSPPTLPTTTQTPTPTTPPPTQPPTPPTKPCQKEVVININFADILR